MSNVALVVMERGSNWPGHVAMVEDVVAFSQDDDSGLLQRTEEKLAALQSAKHDVRVAVLACNESTDDTTASRRSELAHALLSAVSKSRFGRLVLSATSVSPRLRQELLCLAGELTPQLGPGSTTISLQFRPEEGARARRGH